VDIATLESAIAPSGKTSGSVTAGVVVSGVVVSGVVSSGVSVFLQPVRRQGIKIATASSKDKKRLIKAPFEFVFLSLLFYRIV
jgi:hypothetical protein